MLIVVFDERNSPTAVVDNYSTIKHSTNFKGPGDWSSVVEACDVLRALSRSGIDGYLVTQLANHNPKSINVIRAPQLGDLVTCTRGDLCEDAGKIIRISSTLRTIETSCGGTFTRRHDYDPVWRSINGWILKLTN